MKSKMHVKTNKLSFKRSSLFSGLMLAIGGLGQAAVIQVGTGCNLVEAIESANTDTAVNSCVSGNGDDIIRIPPDQGNFGALTLNSQHVPSVNIGGTYVGTPIVESHITIDGQGQTIRANTDTNKFRIFEVGNGGTLILNDVTVSGGNDDLGLGSGVLNYGGDLQLNNTKLYNNNGAITSVYGNTEINNSVIVSNFIEDQAYAAGVYAFGSVLSLQGSSVINNKLKQIPPLWAESSSSAEGKSGLINRGGGLNAAGITLNNSQAELINSTISGNKGFIGGLVVSNYAIVGKRFKGEGNKDKGGPISSTLISQVTISDNSGQVGGFVFDSNNAPLTLEGTIITGNKSEIMSQYANGYVLAASAINVNAHNFVGENGQSNIYGLTLGASDTIFANSASDNLYPLNLSNGQFVHPLKHGSVAIDGLAKSCYQNVAVDQEGKGRGIDGDSNGSFICDAGSFEHSLPIVVNSGACTLANAITSANIDGSVGGCQPGNGHDIIELPQGSTHTMTQAVESYVSLNNPVFNHESGLPVIRSSMVINGNDSTIERDTNAVEDFSLLNVSNGHGLILNETTVTGVNAGIAAVAGWYGSEVQIFNSQITDNQSVGVLSVLNQISGIENSMLSGNIGSSDPTFQNFASVLIASYSNNFRMKNNLITGNQGAKYGGLQLIASQGLVMSNNTISNNIGGDVGGMVIGESEGLITHNTITQNSGSDTGGVMTSSENTLKLSHNIISGNIQTGTPPDEKRGVALVSDVLVSGSPVGFVTSHNIFGQNGVSETDGFVLDATDMVPAGSVNTVIESVLADNGGNTFSHIPVAGGLAVDTGSADCEFNRIDQRNFIRPWDGDADGSATCDIGAIEVNSVHEDDLIFKDGFDDGGIIL